MNGRNKMPKLVCVDCQCELKPETNGTTVIETASFGVYKVWSADTWKCPGCGKEIVAGFGQEPLRADHWADDFSNWVKSLEFSATKIVYDNERPKGE
jgi:hypothetical protein